MEDGEMVESGEIAPAAMAQPARFSFDLIDKVMEILLEGESGTDKYAIVDLRKEEYSAIPLVSRQFLDSYLTFFTKMPRLSTSLQDWGKNLLLEFTYYADYSTCGRNTAAPCCSSAQSAQEFTNGSIDRHFKRIYRTPPGMIKLLAIHKKLSILKAVNLTVKPEWCMGNQLILPPAACLVQLCGLEAEPIAGDLTLDTASICFHKAELLRNNVVWLDAVLGLNATNTRLAFYPPLISSSAILVVPDPSPDRFSRILRLTLTIGTSIPPWPSNDDDEDGTTFPAREWVAVISRLIATCGSMRALELIFSSCAKMACSQEVSKQLDLYNSAIHQLIVQMVHQKLSAAAASIRVEFGLFLSTTEDLAEIHNNHPLFDLGSLKEENRVGEELCEVIREIEITPGSGGPTTEGGIDQQGERRDYRDPLQGAEGEEGQQGRKVVTWKMWNAKCRASYSREQSIE